METIESKVCELYKSGKSTYEIASMLGPNWYSQKVRRLLKKCGIKLRDKSESQITALNSGRISHPTKGKHHSAATKSVIGKSVSQAWENITDEERLSRSNKSKANWDLLSEAQQKELRELAAKAVRKAAIEGSKAEKYLLIKLRNAGWEVEFHTTKRLPTQSMQLDFFIPKILTCIEIDGANHWKNIWGYEAFERTKKSDQKKNALLIQNGYNIIRIQTKINKVSNVYMNKVWNILEKELEKLRDNFRKNVEDRLMIIEVEK